MQSRIDAFAKYGREQRDSSGAVVAALTELIDAIDRRVPQVERAGEIRIAREAAAFKKAAVTRIEALKRARCVRETREAALADAVMNDDGGPVRDEGRRSPAALTEWRNRPIHPDQAGDA